MAPSLPTHKMRTFLTADILIKLNTTRWPDNPCDGLLERKNSNVTYTSSNTNFINKQKPKSPTRQKHTISTSDDQASLRRLISHSYFYSRRAVHNKF